MHQCGDNTATGNSDTILTDLSCAVVQTGATYSLRAGGAGQRALGQQYQAGGSGDDINDTPERSPASFLVSVHQNTVIAAGRTLPSSSHSEAGPCRHSRLPSQVPVRGTMLTP